MQNKICFKTIMPKIAFYKFLEFFMFTQDLSEPFHLHVEARKGKRRYPAKIFIENGIEVKSRGNLSDNEINLAIHLIEKNLGLINKQINNFSEGKKKINRQ